ncbi:MAG: ABC transporter permease [Chloroflexia bacterium]
MLNTSIAGERGRVWREVLRTFRVATWLGWQVESNWADPFVFLSLAVLRPVATALMIVVMYQVISGGARSDFFTYLYVSNAFFVIVVQTLAGMAWVVLDDRENYKMLKYIYTSPARKFTYLLGRAVSKMMIGLLTTLILLATGLLFLGLPIQFDRVEWGMLAVYFALGMMILGGLGMVLAGVALVVARHGESLGEVVAGMLLLFSGAYFPPDILPSFLRTITFALPITYWLEAMRRALNGGILETARTVGGVTTTTPISPVLASISDIQLLGILLVSAVVCVAGSLLFYGWVENQAKERGMIDRTSRY